MQGQFVAYLNSLTAMGVDGYRIDAAKHLLPAELQTMLGQHATRPRSWARRSSSRTR
ncbi:MAG: hypothetical protein QM767_00665 [Anaeromyxobacter sp.]